jgi:MbtH protein
MTGVTMSDTKAEMQYEVVVNHEEQYSIWSAGRELPLGWNTG